MKGKLARLCEHDEIKEHERLPTADEVFGIVNDDWVAPQLTCPGGVFLPDDTLIREWRCWREDGSYYGPCPPMGEPWEHEVWREDRHGDCGWQWYFMEPLDALSVREAE